MFSIPIHKLPFFPNEIAVIWLPLVRLLKSTVAICFSLTLVIPCFVAIHIKPFLFIISTEELSERPFSLEYVLKFSPSNLLTPPTVAIQRLPISSGQIDCTCVWESPSSTEYGIKLYSWAFERVKTRVKRIKRYVEECELLPMDYVNKKQCIPYWEHWAKNRR